MNVSNIMTGKVVAIAPDMPVSDVAALLIESRLSAVPVVDGAKRVIGIVSEGDLMRRPETGTLRPARWWLQLVTSPEALAADYVKSHGLAAKDVMTRSVVTITPDASLGDAAQLMESRHVKRLPVTRDGVLVGIVARADLVRALVAAPPLQAGAHDDTLIRQRLEETLTAEPWVSSRDIYVTVLEHEAHLWGNVKYATQSQALELLARAVPGVTSVRNHLIVR
jgi:CBS domain-containing protein